MFRPMRSPAGRAILALLIGLAIGATLRAVPTSPAHAVAVAVEPLGTLWVNAIRMTVIPLVVSLVIVGIAAPRDTRRIGRLGAYTAAFIFGTLGIVALISTFVTPAAFSLLEMDANAASAARASVAATTVPASIPTATDWMLSLVPSNPIRAAADGALLPLLVFSVMFAFALIRVADPLRRAVLDVFRAIGDAMLVVVTWVVWLAPLGVFGLALALGRTLGLDAVGAIGFYIAFVCAFNTVVTLAMYPVAVAAGRIPIREFARAALPAQVIAFTARSSLAALPVMIRGATERMHVPPAITGFVLPLAVSVYKLTSPTYWPAGALLIGRLYGVDLDLTDIAIVALASVILSTSAPGIPAGGLFVQAPVYVAVGLPVEGLGILLAVDVIPDMFKTTLNVTSQLAGAAAVARADAASARTRTPDETPVYSP